MLLTACDDVTRYKIEVPDCFEVRLDLEGTDFLLIPDPERPDVSYWLCDYILVEAARSGAFGLRLIAEEPVEAGTNEGPRLVTSQPWTFGPVTRP